MEEEKEPQRNAGGRGITDYMPEYKVTGNLFRRAIWGYTCQHVVRHGTKMQAKTAKFDVSMDETFLPETMKDMRIVKVTARIFPYLNSTIIIFMPIISGHKPFLLTFEVY